MLTVTEIKNKKFEKSAFGYKVDDVESFLNEVIDLVAALEKDKAETEKKLVVLANKIEEYRTEEDSLRQALLGAQKLGDSILKEAKNRAEIMMRDATIKSENIIKNVKDEVKREEVILNKMKREVDAFRSKMLTMYGSHVELIKSIPEVERTKEQQEEAQAPAETCTVAEIKEPEIISEEVAEADVVAEVPVETAVTDTEEAVEETTAETEAEEQEKEEGFKISGGFKFINENEKTESKFGPLKFGEGYDLEDDRK